MRRLAAALALGASLIASAGASAADIRAFQTSDGSDDPAFVKLGATTRVDSVVPDGSHGVYLLGHIIVDGGARQIVHLRPGGGVDRLFRPVIRGGLLEGGAVHGRNLVLFGTFRSIGGKGRARIGVVDARTGRPLAWKPQLPIAAGLFGIGAAAFSGRTLVVSTDGGLFAWRPGASRPAWERRYQFAPIAPWHGAIWAVVTTPRRGEQLASIDPATGRTRFTGRRMHHVDALQVIGGRLIALGRGSYWRADHPADGRLASCGQASGGKNAGLRAVALAGDARTLYVADSPASLDVPGRIPGVTACPWSGGATRFLSPAFAYTGHGPAITAIALVGTHVLAFTRGA